jgi:hypothetical protein
MIIPPLALIFGAGIGLIARGHRRVVTLIAFSAPALALAAFAAQFAPGGAESCTSSIDGSTVCRSVPAVSGWDGPLPYAIATCLVVLTLAPLVNLRTGGWWLTGMSAVLQAVPQVISFGGFIDWAPALLATTAVAFALAWRRTPTSSRLEPVPATPPAPVSTSGSDPI